MTDLKIQVDARLKHRPPNKMDAALVLPFAAAEPIPLRAQNTLIGMTSPMISCKRGVPHPFGPRNNKGGGTARSCCPLENDGFMGQSSLAGLLFDDLLSQR